MHSARTLRPLLRLRSLGLGIVLALIAGAGTALTTGAANADSPRIYKWVDSNGIAHYTTDPQRVPKALRDRIESLERVERTTDPTFERPAVDRPPAPPSAEPEAMATSPAPTTPEAARAASAPLQRIAPPSTGVSGGEAWATRDALPRARSGSSVLASGEASPEQRAALAAEREALDARIAEVEAAIAQDEGVLKDLIADPGLDEDTPLFDQPEFLEVSRRLPELQAELATLRGQRDGLETP